MELIIAHRRFVSEEIKNIVIRDDRVFVDTKEDFFNIPYKNTEEIRDAVLWKRLQNITLKDVQDAVETLIFICDAFINTKTQCEGCPLHNNHGCKLNKIPIDWR